MGFAKKMTYPAVVFGFVAFNALLALAILANPGFSLFTNYLSDLGVGESAIFFNAACILGGFLLIGAFYGFHVMSWKSGICTLGCSIGMLSGLALIGVGIFPETSPLHFPVSAAFFSLAAISVAIYTVNHVMRHGPFDPILAIGCLHFLLSLLLVLSAISNARNIPFFETSTVFVFEIWVLAAAIHHQRKKDG